ncbi:glycoside hydrolase family 3 N-terminal domain-containing protein [Longimicrobium sp.]|uniref:glycoside hydrolase family 3 N-terminal domain-containing protein n=1 Tax=Longimicrobium sp. TaxID=2029185 RepID=UPI002C9060FC|nr:glycoside hydrolase family 3 N-terminal domain-containing protein [Longimicrobium sp.]HSU15527.1 glycoside hydrolase family 3 N-terminal domain-containing protein [Longimicrobium sp.]
MTDQRLEVARLLLPALRWSNENGFEGFRDTIERGLALGVGGFILFGGEADGVRELTAELRRRARFPLLIASDLERGAGQQFRGATPLPPAAAIGWLDDEAVAEHAGELTAREARALGVNWIYAPVADVDLEPENPIIGVRAFGHEPDAVARQVAAWVRGCRRGGALSCAKHFPGHGRTKGDSHIERPTVAVSREVLEDDLKPFRAAVDAGVDSVMTAHVVYPALDADYPATLSPRILGDLLCRELRFDGLVVTDALIMDGLTEDTTEAAAAVRALAAGCDVLLYPQDADAVIRALEAAVADGRLPRARLEAALARIAAAAERVWGDATGEVGAEADRRWALEVGVRSLRVCRGSPALPQGPVRLVEIEDDAGGPYPPYPRDAFPTELRRAGVELSDAGTPLVALYSDIRAWKGRPGISASAQSRVREVTDVAPDATVLLFSHPRLAHEIPTARNLLAAWGGEGVMQEAVAAWLLGESGGAAGMTTGVDR